MKRIYLKNIFVIGVLTLFLILAFTPAIQAENINKSTDNKEELFEIEIEEFKADGSIEKKYIQLTKTETDELKNELLSTKSMEGQLFVLKKYHLIPQDKTIKELETGMNEKAANLGISPDDDRRHVKFRLPILLQFFKKVTAVYYLGISINLGLKFLIRIINKIPGLNLPTLDFADFTGGIFGVITTHGQVLKNRHSLVTFPGVSGMIGFVGYRTKFPFMLHAYKGFSAVTFGLGFGFHIKY